MERDKKAVEIFNQGYNCAQSVVIAHADLLGLPEIEAAALAAGFGAGMGRVQTVCGAVSGAIIVTGRSLYRDRDREVTRELIYDKVNEFIMKFRKRFGSLECIDLTGVDISTAEGMEKAEREGIFRDKCENYVKESCRILEEIL